MTDKLSSAPADRFDQPVRVGVNIDQPVKIVKARLRNWSKEREKGEFISFWKEMLVGRTVRVPRLGDVYITGQGIEKTGSNFPKSISKSAHFDILASLPELLEDGVAVELHPDRKQNQDIRRIHRVYSAVDVAGQRYVVKMTVKEWKNGVRQLDNNDLSFHAYELPKELPAAGRAAAPTAVHPALPDLKSSPTRPDTLPGDPQVNQSYPQGLSKSTTDLPSQKTCGRGYGQTAARNTEKLAEEKAGETTLREMLLGLNNENYKPYINPDGSVNYDDVLPATKLSDLPNDILGSFAPSTNTITLLKSADRSTFLHESGHFFLNVYAELAGRQNGPQIVKKDMQTLLGWFGVKDIDTWKGMTVDQQRKYHEQFAQAFETYLREGKAPVPELRSLFQQFRQWLLGIYRSASIDLSPEVKEVMDRMLASEKEIDSTRNAKSKNGKGNRSKELREPEDQK